jgi:purine-binding chemotaxis protein CheW
VAPRQVIEVLVFALASERYSIETRHILSIARLTDYAALPAAPPHFFGLTAVRGELVVIIDLRRLLHVGVPGLNDMCRLIVLGGDRAEFAILADVVHAIELVAVDDIRPPPDFVSGAGRDYLRGITEGAVQVLDGQAMLDDRKLYLE